MSSSVAKYTSAIPRTLGSCSDYLLDNLAIRTPTSMRYVDTRCTLGAMKRMVAPSTWHLPSKENVSGFQSIILTASSMLKDRDRDSPTAPERLWSSVP